MTSEGTLIGDRYRILTQIGEGGMSRVYLALDTVLNKQWAAKEIKQVKDETQRELIIQSIITEANMIKRLDHAAIPRIVDIVDADGVLYVIMDYIEGRTLEEILQLEGAQKEEHVVSWAIQLCDVLDYLHHREPPVIYRDMKPSNIMLKPNGTVQLIDFGIAREYREGEEDITAAVSDTVQLGTRGFAPPEQYGGNNQTDARTDIYALGATLYYLLTNQSPAEPPYTMVPIRQINPELSPGLEKIISKATHNNPDDRFQSAAEMAYELEHYHELDEQNRALLKRKWYGFVAGCAATILFTLVGLFGTGMYHHTLASDYNYWMQVAEQTSDYKETEEFYLKAIDIRPGSIEPYQGLINLYKEDQNFTPQEEEQLRGVLLPNLNEFDKDESWAKLSFDLGKLYWYSYDTNGADVTSKEYEDNRSKRIRAAAQWMEDAASIDGFEDQKLARAYADVAKFNTEIVPLINEGSDLGKYSPYFNTLALLVTELQKEENDVVKLEAANLTLDALATYPRKFRADGISESSMTELLKAAINLANSVVPTTQKLDSSLARVNGDADLVLVAVQDAYVDVEA